MDKIIKKQEKFWSFDKEDSRGIWLINNGLCIILINFQHKFRSSYTIKGLSKNEELAIINFYEYP